MAQLSVTARLIALLLASLAATEARLCRPVLLRLSGGAAPQWSVHTSDDGRPYYFDEMSGVSTWDCPPELAEATQGQAAAAPQLPDGWSQHMTPEGIPYYYHEASGQSSWDPPFADAAGGDGQPNVAEQVPADEAMASDEAVGAAATEGTAMEQGTDQQAPMQQEAEAETADFAALLAARAQEGFVPQQGAVDDTLAQPQQEEAPMEHADVPTALDAEEAAAPELGAVAEARAAAAP